MTMTSATPQVIDYLVAQAQASARLGRATPPVAVFDGLQPPGGSQEAPRALWIGADPSAPGDPMASAQQDWPVMDKGRTRDEDGDIILAAQYYSGDTTTKVNRDGAAAIVAGVELLLRGDGTTGSGDITMAGLVMWAGVDGPFTWSQRQRTNGALCLVTFHVRYRARLLATGP